MARFLVLGLLVLGALALAGCCHIPCEPCCPDCPPAPPVSKAPPPRGPLPPTGEEEIPSLSESEFGPGPEGTTAPPNVRPPDAPAPTGPTPPNVPPTLPEPEMR